MTGTPAELVKEKLDIVEFLRQYLTLQAAGRNFKALCPFHKEKTASFMISPDRQTWHCFGCGVGGDVFSFITKYENIEFPEALRILAEKAGVELRRTNPAEHHMTGLLYEINAAAKDFFRDALKKSDAAQKYLKERGLAKETADTFEIGWASDDMEALSMHLIKKGFAADEIISAGLAWKNARGLLGDRFRGRIMFPIHNHFGKIAGFTGRILPQLENPDTGGKYVNTPETPIFQKHKLLYGFWKSKDAIRDMKEALLVEGQMDFLVCWQIGLRNVVATSGTAITHDHLAVLRRLADRLILTLDSDEAGKDAGERVIDLANLHDFDTKVVLLAHYKDPAEAGIANSDYLHECVANASSAMEFYFTRYLPRNHADYRTRENLSRVRIVLQKMKSLESPIARSFWLHELSSRTGIPEVALAEESARTLIPRTDVRAQNEEPLSGAEKKIQSRKELLAERLLAAAVMKSDLTLAQSAVEYFPELHRSAYRILESGKKTSENPSVNALLDAISFAGSTIAEDEDIKDLKQHLIKEHFRERKEEITKELRAAENAGDDKRVAALLDESNAISLRIASHDEKES